MVIYKYDKNGIKLSIGIPFGKKLNNEYGHHLSSLDLDIFGHCLYLKL